MLMLLPVHHAPGMQTNILIKLWLGHYFMEEHTHGVMHGHTRKHINTLTTKQQQQKKKHIEEFIFKSTSMAFTTLQ